MIDEDAQAARRYRQRAREVRTVANTIEEMTTRSALLEIARDYDAIGADSSPHRKGSAIDAAEPDESCRRLYRPHQRVIRV